MDAQYVEQLLDWSKPEETIFNGKIKVLRKATATPQFWEVYKTEKLNLKALGVVATKVSNKWWVIWRIEKDLELNKKEAIKSSSTVSTSNIILKKPNNLEYMDFQKTGIEYALGRKYTLIADEMGLGKTVQALGVINNIDSINTVLIICPKSLMLNWEKECKKWLVKDFTIGLVKKDIPDTQIVIINYDIVKKWIVELTTCGTKEKEWDLIILDEAHYIKNTKAIRSKAVKKIKAKKHLRLTGTPILNRPIELFNIVNDAECGMKNYMQFARRYADAKRSPWGLDVSGASNLDELQAKLRQSIMIRRLKSDVLKNLPSKSYQIVPLQVTREQTKLIAKEYELEDYYNRLFEMPTFNELSKIRHLLALSKVNDASEYIIDQLENSDKKIVVAAHHTDVIEKLFKNLSKYNPVKIVGDMDNANREKSVVTFQNDSSCRVFIASIKAAGVGITLTASDWVIFVELDRTPGSMLQMEDRCHRIGQKSNVLVTYLVLNGSCDDRDAQLLSEKQNVINQVLNNNPEKVESITTNINTSKVNISTCINKAKL